MKSQVVLLILSSFVLMVGFQNCAKRNYAQGLNVDSSLKAADLDDETVIVENPDVPQDEEEIVEDKDDEVAKEEDREDKKDCKKDRAKNDDVADEDQGQENAEGARFVCVVEGAGKSQKIALDNSSLVSKVGTPQDVCMTEHACLDIVSQKFEVKSAEARGFCPRKNPHVIALSDEEVQALVDKIQ